MYAHTLNNFKFDLNFNSKCSLSVNFNIKVCLIIMQITICLFNCADHHLPDHYANMGTADKHQRIFEHCADHHLPDLYANMIQLSKL